MLQWHALAVWRACIGPSIRQSSALVWRWPQCTVHCVYCSFDAQHYRPCVATGAIVASLCLEAVSSIAPWSIQYSLRQTCLPVQCTHPTSMEHNT